MIGWAVFAAYMSLGLLVARNRFRAFRPLTVPSKCDKSILCNYGRGPHYRQKSGYAPCYQSDWGQKLCVSTDREAAGFAVGAGLFWPVIVLELGAVWVVSAGNHREKPDEMQARIDELERELGMR